MTTNKIEMRVRLLLESINNLNIDDTTLLHTLTSLRTLIQHNNYHDIFLKSNGFSIFFNRLHLSLESKVKLNKANVSHMLAIIGYILQSNKEHIHLLSKEKHNAILLLINYLKQETCDGIMLLIIQILYFSCIYYKNNNLDLSIYKSNLETFIFILKTSTNQTPILNKLMIHFLFILVENEQHLSELLYMILLKHIATTKNSFSLNLLIICLYKILNHNQQITINYNNINILLTILSQMNDNNTEEEEEKKQIIIHIFHIFSIIIERMHSNILNDTLINDNMISKLIHVITYHITDDSILIACSITCSKLLKYKQSITLCILLKNMLQLNENDTCKLKAIRIIRQLLKISMPLFLSINIHKSLIITIQNNNIRQDIRKEILQEVSLIMEIENNQNLIKALRDDGILNVLTTIVNENMITSPNLLCNSTRAVACFVEHITNDSLLNLTHILSMVECHHILIKLLNQYGSNNINQTTNYHEVLLNTIGALGYMIKHFSKIIKKMIYIDKTLLNNIQENKLQTCKVLIEIILYCKYTSDNLLWNIIWSLIYLMDNGKNIQCVKQVIQANGKDAFIKLFLEEKHDSSIIASAAQGFCCCIITYPELITNLNLKIRLMLLSSFIRTCQDINIDDDDDDDEEQQQQEDENHFIVTLNIKQQNIIESSIQALKNVDIIKLRKKNLIIKYNQQIGIDNGGLRRDWISSLSHELFNKTNTIIIPGFEPNDCIQLTPYKNITKELKEKYYIIGKLIGISLLYRDPLGIHFVPSFYKLLLNQIPTFDDLKHVSIDYYNIIKNLQILQQTNETQFHESIKDLTFTVNSRESMIKEAMKVFQEGNKPDIVDTPKSIKSFFKDIEYIIDEEELTLEQISKKLAESRKLHDRTRIRQLMKLQNKLLHEKDNITSSSSSSSNKKIKIDNNNKEEEQQPPPLMNAKLNRSVSIITENGENLEINPTNFTKYINSLVKKVLIDNIQLPMKFIKQGLYEIIPCNILSILLNHIEFNELIQGDTDVNVDLWMKYTKYKGGNETSPVVVWFWNYIKLQTKQKRQQILQWATGWRSISSHNGFNNKHFTIELTTVTNKMEDSRLPSVATCGFCLWLPMYSSKEQMIQKLERAIQETSFGIC